MPQWTTFAAITGVVLVFLLGLSQLTQSAFSDDTASRADGHVATHRADNGSRSVDNHYETPRSATDHSTAVDADDTTRPVDERDRGLDPDALSTGAVLANVAASQGVFALALIGAAIYTGIPADAFGIEFSRSSVETGLLQGTAFGVGLYLANEVAAAAATWLGLDHDEGLRELLAPESARGWLVLVVVVLPIIAIFEELLFRAALIGVIATGFGIDPWLLAIGSSIVFALGHGIQGSVGVLVTGLLGFVLAAGFILTGSFLVVVVAHYWINAFEFVVHEGLGFDWTETIEHRG